MGAWRSQRRDDSGGNGVGNAAGQFNFPVGICGDGNGSLYIADAGNNRIEKWAAGAVAGVTVAGGNGKGNAPNQFDDPLRVAIDGNGNLYIGDNNNFRVQKWAVGASNGVTVAGGNGGGSGPNQFGSVDGLCLDAAGNIYVADNLNNRIQKWAPGAVNGITVAGGNGPGSAANQLTAPVGLFVDRGGNIYVGDYGNERVQKWEPGATSGITVAGGNGTGSSVSQLNDPEAVFVDGSGNIYVSDSGNFRVQRFGPPIIVKTYTPLIPGSYTGVVTTDGGCTLTTNVVIINPVDTPAISIAAVAAADACDPVKYNAVAYNSGVAPSYQWQVNGADVGANSPSFTDGTLGKGDSVDCILASHEICVTNPAVRSNSIVVLAASPIPVVPPGQVFSMSPGQPITLAPLVTGDISSYLWRPATGLSDSTIRDPVADPAKTTSYELLVTSAEGCTASGDITVKVFFPVRIPNAFTPNGDGKNDVFYVLGGPDGSLVKDFSIFNRWGQKVFQVHDVSPNDPGAGWNGYYRGSPAPVGTYVYVIAVALAGGGEEVFKGLVVLIR